MTSSTDRLVQAIAVAFAAQREEHRQRILAGLAVARRYHRLGRPPIYERLPVWHAKTVRSIARELNVSRSTAHRLIHRQTDEQQRRSVQSKI